MSDFGKYSSPTDVSVDSAYDPGLRQFLLGVYAKMALGLVVAGVLSWVTSSYPPVKDLLYVTDPNGALRGFTLLGNIVGFGPLALMLFAAVGLRRASPSMAGILFWTIVALVGASMGALVLMYTTGSIALTFMITAGAFAGLSLIGYTTKVNLGPMRSFLIICLLGLVLTFAAVILLPMFGASFGTFSVGPMFMIMNGLGILISAGLIASEAQHMKLIYYAIRDDERAMRAATSIGALNLFIDFTNLFRFLLYFMGVRRD